MTESEMAFQRFCATAGLDLIRIPESAQKSADYLLQLQNTRVYVEIKQIEYNSEELALLSIPVEEWIDPQRIYHWGMPGERIRQKIINAMPQLKASAGPTFPTLLVIQNLAGFWPELADEDAIKVAMYGIETIMISSDAAFEGGAKILSRWHGGRKRLTPAQNTSLSGIAILRICNDTCECLDVFHNYYAKNKLPPIPFDLPNIQQYGLDSDPRRGFPRWSALKEKAANANNCLGNRLKGIREMPDLNMGSS